MIRIWDQICNIDDGTLNIEIEIKFIKFVFVCLHCGKSVHNCGLTNFKSLSKNKLHC